jgi:hypothetical protein
VGDRVRESYVTDNKPMWLLWTGDEYDQRDSIDDAIIRFDAVLREIRDDAASDGEWPDGAESTPALWVAYPLMLHTLVPDVDEDGADVSRSEVVEYADPVSAITAERDAALARVAMLEAARSADRAMLCRILGVESDASISVLLEQVETLLGRRVERGEP